jgi:hypothetical protein
MSSPVADLQARRAARAEREVALRAAAEQVTPGELVEAVDRRIVLALHRLEPVLRQVGPQVADLLLLAEARDRATSDIDGIATWCLAAAALRVPALSQVGARCVSLRIARTYGTAPPGEADVVDAMLVEFRRGLAVAKLKARTESAS